MEKKWHIHIGDDQNGPFAAIAVQAMFNSGKIDAKTMLWCNGMQKWKPLKHIQELSYVLLGEPIEPQVAPPQAIPTVIVQQTVLQERAQGASTANPDTLPATTGNPANQAVELTQNTQAPPEASQTNIAEQTETNSTAQEQAILQEQVFPEDTEAGQSEYLQFSMKDSVNLFLRN